MGSFSKQDDPLLQFSIVAIMERATSVKKRVSQMNIKQSMVCIHLHVFLNPGPLFSVCMACDISVWYASNWWVLLKFTDPLFKNDLVTSTIKYCGTSTKCYHTFDHIMTYRLFKQNNDHHSPQKKETRLIWTNRNLNKKQSQWIPAVWSLPGNCLPVGGAAI